MPRRVRTRTIAMTIVVFAVVVCAARPRGQQLQTSAVAAPTDPVLHAAFDDAQRAYARQDLTADAAAFERMLARARELHDELWEGRALLGLGTIAGERLQSD